MEKKPLEEKEKKSLAPNSEQNTQSEQKPEIAYEYGGKVYSDEDLATYFKHEHFLFKVFNKMLGDYDQNGKYKLPNEILKDLLALRKVPTKTENQTTFLKSTCGSITFLFKLEIGNHGTDKKYAQLYLIESAVEIPGQEKQEVISPIAFYTDDADAYFETKVKKVFNILTQEEVDGGREKENEQLALALLEKIKFMGKIYDAYLNESRLRDKIYVEKILKILAQDAHGALILKKYEQLLKQYQGVLDTNNKNYYRILKQLLDQALLEEEKSLSREVALLLQRLRKVYVQANTQTIDVVKAPPQKKQEKKEEKAKKASGPGAITFKYASSAASKSGGSKKYSSVYTTSKPMPNLRDFSSDSSGAKAIANTASIDFLVNAYKGAVTNIIKEQQQALTKKVAAENENNNKQKAREQEL